MITWNYDLEKELELLNKYFKTWTFEKHPKVMMGIMFDRAFEKVLGKHFKKQQISKKKMARFQDELRSSFQGTYGKYINISLHKSARSNPDCIKFETNFNHVFKTEFGILYGAPNTFYCGNVYYTYHCFQRFGERCDPDIVNCLTKVFVEKYKYPPTIADLVMLMTSTSKLEYAKWEKFYYLNISTGVIVLEDYGDFFVAKTYLSPEMIDARFEWFKPNISEQSAKEEYEKLMEGERGSLKRVLDHKPFFIGRPEFLGEEEKKPEESSPTPTQA